MKTITNNAKEYAHWEKTKDLVDQLIDIILNYRQSGHPGGSRSKVHMLLTLLLSGAMRWDIRNPGRRFGDRFILSAGHTVPLVYCTLAVLNEAMRIRFARTQDRRFALPEDPAFVLQWKDLLNFRHRGGLSGHAEMEGKTLFLKFNTGPSGHGSLAAVGEALALKRAGAAGVRVFAMEGEGGLTPGATHEAMNSAWGLKLDNLFFLIDWNDFGIDDRPFSSIVYGTPQDWFASHGWRVAGTEHGEDWAAVDAALKQVLLDDGRVQNPAAVWTKTRKGRGYLKYDNTSHGLPHGMNSGLFWETKKQFMERYGAAFVNVGGQAPENETAIREEFKTNLQVVIQVLHDDQELVDYLSDRLAGLGESVPDEIQGFKLGKRGNPLDDARLVAFEHYPADLYAAPGSQLANRAALAKWGAWVNAFCAKEYGQPAFIACSADLCDSTNVSGFGKPYGEFPGYGWITGEDGDEGVLLPQGITEMANAGLLAGLATVNFAGEPAREFAGFWGACSTYGSFSYLKYGMFRLLSQLVQHCQYRTGKVIWVAGHSGPETADDSRTHFGIFATGVTQLFPKGQVINIHPWEYNEVPVLLGAALREDVPIVALHLTRPAITIPDRQALGIPSHFEAAKGAYIVRDYRQDQPHGGALFVQGTSAMANLIPLLPELEHLQLNVKMIYVASPELFARQPAAYQERVIAPGDRLDSTVVTTQARRLMHEWIFNPLAEEYALSSDWDDRWRTGGTLEEVLDEAHLTPQWLLEGIQRFVHDRENRLQRLHNELDSLNI